MIPHSRPSFDTADEEAVLRVLRSGQVAQGEEVRKLEEEMSKLTGVEHAVAVSSGSAALHLTLLSLGIGEGDEVIIPSYTCAALLNAVRYTGAKAVVVDISETDFNLSAEAVEKKISTRTKAIIVPHMFGLSADLDGLLKLGIDLIEDCAQSLGSFYKGKITGSLGRLSVFSFYATKVISSGEGGMILTRDRSLAEQIKDLREYDEKDSDRLRFNYKLTDLQAALARSQLERLEYFLNRRKEIANRYSEILKPRGISCPHVPEGRSHIYFRYCLKLSKPEEFIKEMENRGIVCRRPVYRPIHTHLGLDDCPVTEKVWKHTVSIPIYPGLTTEEITHIGESLIELQERGILCSIS